MAITITAQIALQFASDSETDDIHDGVFTITTTGSNYTQSRQTIAVAATAEALQKGDVGTCGWMWIRNLSSTAAETITVRYASDAGKECVTIPASGQALFKFPSGTTAPYVISGSGTPAFKYFLAEA
jgi:hypothetical protein